MIRWWERIARLYTHGVEIEQNLYLKTESRDSYVATYRGRRIKVYTEMLSGKPNRIVYSERRKKWLPPHEIEPVSDADYTFIIDAVVKHFEKHGETVECQ